MPVHYRRSGSCLRDYCKTCVHRAPARPVRACCVRSCCTLVVEDIDPRTTPAQRNAKQTLSSHFMLPFSRPALHMSHMRFTLYTSSDLEPMRALLTSSDLFSAHFISTYLPTDHLGKCFSFFHCSVAMTHLSHLFEVFLPERILLHKTYTKAPADRIFKKHWRTDRTAQKRCQEIQQMENSR